MGDAVDFLDEQLAKGVEESPRAQPPAAQAPTASEMLKAITRLSKDMAEVVCQQQELMQDVRSLHLEMQDVRQLQLELADGVQAEEVAMPSTVSSFRLTWVIATGSPAARRLSASTA